MIQQKATKINVATPKLPLVHGHTKIVLTSVKDGSQKVIEHDNVFQSTVLEKFLRSFGTLNGSPWRNSTWSGRPTWRNLCGGILLFDDTIDTTGGAVEYLPTGISMVANGACGVANASVPTELGTYNTVESSTNGATSLTFVYDWGTSQGNGTIKCVCLTSETGGYIGYGNTSGDFATARDFFENQTVNSLGNCCVYDNYKYTVVSLDTTNKKVVIRKSISGVEETSLFFNQDSVDTEYTYTGDILVGSGSYSDRIHFRQVSEKTFAIVKNNNATIASGATARILVFNMDTEAVGYITIVNTSGKTIPIIDGSIGSALRNYPVLTQDSSGNTYVYTSDGDLLKFGSNGTLVGTVAELGILDSHSRKIGKISPDIIYCEGSVGTISQYTRKAFICNGTDANPCNGYVPGDGSVMEYNEDLDSLTFCSADEFNISHFKNPMYLATVNNLQTAVTKDSSQTMKVIYTLSQA